ncbi:MAG: tetratricopeptide repeat protein, partial [Bacteroidetes bacterium]|nr:tetratricopeptide repeat protein [Bacteroidota bacterium]
MEHVLNRSLAKDPDDRYQSATEMASELMEAQKGPDADGIVRGKGVRPLLWRRPTVLVAVLSAIVVALIAGYLIIPWQSDLPDRKSIAVLPFENMSGEKENEYFSDGLTEDVIAQLSKIHELKVTSRTSVMQYKKVSMSLREIGRELDVFAILEGSVRRAGKRVRIVAQLVDAEDDVHLWSETYERDMTDIFAIQSDVARQIAGTLRAELTPAEQASIAREPTANLTAYDDYLNARFFRNKRTLEDTWKAIGFFEAAIEKDSSFALAYSGIADCYVVDAGHHLGVSVDEAENTARTFALEALALDSTIVEARTVLAQIRWLHEWDLQGADEGFKRALEINPNNVTALRRYAWALVAMDRYDEAIETIERAQRLDPLSFITNIDKAMLLLNTRRYDESIAQCRKALKMNPDHRYPRFVLAESFRQKG